MRWVLPDEANLTNTNLASFSCYTVRPLWDVKTSITLGLLDREAYDGYKTTIKEQIAAFPGIRAMRECF